MAVTVRAPRVFECVVERIEGVARSGALRPGDRLPTERQLAAHFGVSRACVREALRVLELRGFVEVRRGVKGGQFLARFDARVIARELAALLRLARFGAAELAEARLALEPEVARLAALRATPSDLRELQAVVGEARAARGTADAVRVLDVTFHGLVARAAAAPVPALVVASLVELQADASPPPGARVGGEREEVDRAHRKIFAALAARDAPKAYSLMRAHLLEVRHRLARAERRAKAEDAALEHPGPDAGPGPGAPAEGGGAAGTGHVAPYDRQPLRGELR